MKKFFFIVLNIVFMISCTLNNENSSKDWEFIVNNIEEKEILQTTNFISMYGGETKEEKYEKKPPKGKKFVLLDLTINKLNPNIKKFDLDNLSLTIQNTKYSVVKSNAFLSQHGYNPINEKNSLNNNFDGIILFEVKKEKKIDKNNIKFKYNNIDIKMDDSSKMIFTDDYFDFENSNVSYNLKKDDNKSIITYRKKKYTFGDPLIILNPYKTSPLTALVIFDVDTKAKVNIQVKGKDEYSNINHNFTEYSVHHEIPIYGLYPNKNNKILLNLEFENGIIDSKEISIQTDKLPEDYYTIEVKKTNPKKMEKGLTFIATVGDTYNSIIDNNGDTRWYSTHKSDLIFKRLKNGNLLMNTKGRDEFIEMDLLGKIYKRYLVLGENIHHDILELKNGNFLITTIDKNQSEDTFIEINRNTGEVVKKIDLSDVLDDTRYLGKELYEHIFFTANPIDWFHLNAIEEHKDGISLSGRNQSSIVKLDRKGKNIKWILGDHINWKIKYKKYLLKPIGKDFSWLYGQHSQVELVDFDNDDDTIDLLLFDNGVGRRNKNKVLSDNENYSRAVHYRINEKLMTVEQIWEFGKEKGAELYSLSVGDANYLPEKHNILSTFGELINKSNYKSGKISSRIIETTYPESEIVFDIELNFKDLSRVYRAERLELYPENYTGKFLENETEVVEDTGSYSILKPINIENIEITKFHGNIDEISINAETKTLKLVGWGIIKNIDSKKVKKELILVSNEYVYSTELENVLREDVQLYMKKMEKGNFDYREAGFNNIIALNNLNSGKYKVYIRLNDGYNEKLYETDYFFTLKGNKDTEIIKRQEKIEDTIKRNWNSKNYTFEDMLVILNPYNNSPLTALLMFNTDEECKVKITILGKDKQTTINHKIDIFSKRHTIPIYGLYSNKNNVVIVDIYSKNGNKKSKKIRIKTEDISDFIPKIEVKNVNKHEVRKGLIFMSSLDGSYAIDLNGDVRWYLNDKLGSLGPVHRTQNGHLIIMNNDTIKQPYYKSGFYEMNMLGKIYSEYKTNGVHHDIIELPNMNFLALVNSPKDTVEDYMIELDRETGKVVREWDLKEIFNLDEKKADPTYVEQELEKTTEVDGKSKIIKKYREDWLHQNSVFYDKKSNSLIISSRLQDAVFSIDYNTSELKWIFSDPNDKWNESMKKKLLEFSDNKIEYTYGQHGAQKINDLLMIYDNGNFRTKVYSKKLSINDNYSRAVVYRINEEKKLIEQIWEYGKENGKENYTPFIGNFELIGDDYYLINFGGIIIDHNGKITDDITETSNQNSKRKAIIVEIKKGKEILNIVLSGKGPSANIYRAIHSNIYYDNEVYNFLR